MIHYALAALKGVGTQAVESIVEARGTKPFADFADFATRINPRPINKRVLESLAAAGAFDAFESNRAKVCAGVETLLAAANRAHESAQIGQNELFGASAGGSAVVLPEAAPWLPAERLQHEYDAVGFFLSGHPLDEYGPALRRLRVQTWQEFVRAVKNGASAGRVAATVVSRSERRTKTGNKMGILGLSDPTGQFEAVMFSETLGQYRDVVEPGNAVLFHLGAELQGDEVRARVNAAEPLDLAAARTQKGLRIFIRDDKPAESVAARLNSVRSGKSGAAAHGAAHDNSVRGNDTSPEAGSGVQKANGKPPDMRGASPSSGAARQTGEGPDSEVALVVLLDGAVEVEMKLPGRYRVTPQIAGALKAVPGVVSVELLLGLTYCAVDGSLNVADGGLRGS